MLQNEKYMIHNGDCLDIMQGMKAESIDLIYLDPPFNKHQTFKGASGSFDDSIQDYYPYMKTRLVELYRILKNTGSLYLHCDYTASHYLKIILDEIFGVNNFINEIIWRRASFHQTTKKLGSIHDTILSFSKSSNYYFSPPTKPMDSETINRLYTQNDEYGRYYHDNLTGGKSGGKESYLPFNGTLPSQGRAWTPITRKKLPQWAKNKLPENYEKLNQLEKCHALDEIGLIYWSKSRKPYFKRYLPDNPVEFIPDLWTDISAIASMSNERVNYPTQKPIKLLERIISISSKKGDTILDPFCGSGTTLVAAYNLDRKYIGIDKSPDAVKTTQKRLAKLTAQTRL